MARPYHLHLLSLGLGGRGTDQEHASCRLWGGPGALQLSDHLSHTTKAVSQQYGEHIAPQIPRIAESLTQNKDSIKAAYGTYAKALEDQVNESLRSSPTESTC